MNKDNNNRKYPAANHQPRHKALNRKLDAELRQEAYDKLTYQQKLDKLPPEPACKKQRDKLLAAIEKKNVALTNAPKTPTVVSVEDNRQQEPSSKEKKSYRKYMRDSK